MKIINNDLRGNTKKNKNFSTAKGREEKQQILSTYSIWH